MGIIRSMAEMSAVSTAASASTSNVRHAAAVTPAGHGIGAAGTVLLTSSVPGPVSAKTVASAPSSGNSPLSDKDRQRGVPGESDLRQSFGARLILEYEKIALTCLATTVMSVDGNHRP